MLFRVGLCCLATVLGCFAAAVEAAPRKAEKAVRTVELFEGIRTGEIEVRFIPENATKGLVLIKNKTKDEIHVKFPTAFGATPVLKKDGKLNRKVLPQFGQGVGQQGFGGQGVGGGQQNLGGGLGGQQGFGGQGVGGQAPFAVRPEKVRKIKVTTVCLEHGKEDPNPRTPYTIKPIEEVAQNQKVIEICKMIGRGEIDQRSAQAATWHHANGLTWQQLARKIKKRHLNGRVELWFHRAELARAVRIAQVAEQRAEAYEKQKADSLSRR